MRGKGEGRECEYMRKWKESTIQFDDNLPTRDATNSTEELAPDVDFPR